jgi:hypothetical protein
MKLGYDIFCQLDDGSPLWVAQVDSVGEAKKKLVSLLASTPGQYFVRDAATGEVVSGLASPGVRLDGPDEPSQP